MGLGEKGASLDRFSGLDLPRAGRDGHIACFPVEGLLIQRLYAYLVCGEVMRACSLGDSASRLLTGRLRLISTQQAEPDREVLTGWNWWPVGFREYDI